MFKGLEEYKKRREQDFMQYVDDDIVERFEKGTVITKDEYFSMTLNSYERKYLFPLYDDELLLYLIEYSLGQEGKTEIYKYDIPKHYIDSVLRLYLPELIRRFKNNP